MNRQPESLPVGPSRSIKKKKTRKVTLQWQTQYSPRPPT